LQDLLLLTSSTIFNPNRSVTLQSYTREAFCELFIIIQGGHFKFKVMFTVSLMCKVPNLDGKRVTKENNPNLEM
jgi:hypothetical protein